MASSRDHRGKKSQTAVFDAACFGDYLCNPSTATEESEEVVLREYQFRIPRIQERKITSIPVSNVHRHIHESNRHIRRPKESVNHVMQNKKRPPSPPPPPSDSFSEKRISLGDYFAGTPHRRMNLFTLLAVAILSPPIFLSGFYVGQGIFYPSSKPAPIESIFGDDEEIDDFVASNTFLIEHQAIHFGESLYLNPTLTGTYLKQEKNGDLVLYNETGAVVWSSEIGRSSFSTTTYHTKLEADGNLVTRARTLDNFGGASTTMAWSSDSGSITGKYSLILNEAQNGLQVVRTDERGNLGAIVWSTTEDIQPSQPSPSYNYPSPVDYPTTPTQPNSPVTQPSPPVTQPTLPPTIPSKMESGPLIGHTTHDSTTVWALAGNGEILKLAFWPSEQPNNTQVVDMPANLAKGASLITIDNLQASTLYAYEVQVEDEIYAEGVFKTAPLPETPTKFKYLLASCINIWDSERGYKVQPVWDIARMKEPDFALLPGDTIYLNSKDWTKEGEILFDRVWFRNLQQRKETHFANFIKSVPTYGAWDDHDYGQGNQGRNQPGKETSLEAWKNLWANPFYGTEDVTGNFYSYVWGDVHFMVMDNRWYRSTSSGSQWGAAQNEWLYDELKTSKSTFKVIVTGSDVLEKGMSVDLDSLGEVITENRISGVLFNAGDIHRNEFKTQEDSYWPYKIMQISSSGIARDWRRPFAIIDVDTTVADPEIVVQFYGATSSNLDTTWHNEPSLKCSDIVGEDRYKESVCTETIRLSDLTPSV